MNVSLKSSSLAYGRADEIGLITWDPLAGVKEGFYERGSDQAIVATAALTLLGKCAEQARNAILSGKDPKEVVYDLIKLRDHLGEPTAR